MTSSTDWHEPTVPPFWRRFQHVRSYTARAFLHPRSWAQLTGNECKCVTKQAAAIVMQEPAGEANVEATRECARTQIEAVWQRVAISLGAGGPFLLGGQLSAADFLMTMLMRWSRNMPKPTDTWPELDEHARRTKARPAFKEVYARQGLTDWT